MIERAGQTYREIRPADFTPRAGDKGRERILGASICGEPRRAASRLSFDARRFRTSGVACFVRLTSGKEERERERKKRDFREYLSGVRVTLFNFKARALRKNIHARLISCFADRFVLLLKGLRRTGILNLKCFRDLI